MAHTQGPWSFEQHMRGDGMPLPGFEVTGGDDDLVTVADVHTTVGDARLITASPDLLDALKVFTDKYVGMINSGDCGFWNPEDEPMVKAARAAIAKAEGR